MSSWLDPIKKEVGDIQSEQPPNQAFYRPPEMEQFLEKVSGFTEATLRLISDTFFGGKAEIDYRPPEGSAQRDARWSLRWGDPSDCGFIRVAYRPEQWEPLSFTLRVKAFCTKCCGEESSTIEPTEKELQELLGEMLLKGAKHHFRLFLS